MNIFEYSTISSLRNCKSEVLSIFSVSIMDLLAAKPGHPRGKNDHYLKVEQNVT